MSSLKRSMVAIRLHPRAKSNISSTRAGKTLEAHILTHATHADLRLLKIQISKEEGRRKTLIRKSRDPTSIVTLKSNKKAAPNVSLRCKTSGR